MWITEKKMETTGIIEVRYRVAGVGGSRFFGGVGGL